jgi:hypothetical protein
MDVGRWIYRTGKGRLIEGRGGVSVVSFCFCYLAASLNKSNPYMMLF